MDELGVFLTVDAFDLYLEVDQMLGGLLLLIFWLVAARKVSALTRRPPEKLPRAVRSARRMIRWAFAAQLAKIAVVVLLASGNYHLAAPAFWVEFPLQLPTLAVALWTVPALRRAARGTGNGPALDEPLVVVPVQATAVGALLVTWSTFFVVPGLPYVRDLVPVAIVLVAATGVLWWRQSRRSGRIPARSSRWLRAAVVLGTVALTVVAVSGEAMASRLPGSMDMMAHEIVDLGGGAPLSGTGGAEMAGMDMAGMDMPGMDMSGGVSTADLTGPQGGPPDVRFTLTAAPMTARLSSGATVSALAFNGQVPGPELRVHQGDLVEVELVNRMATEGVTIHWHGYDVPNAEDGVAGLTQDAVPPGGSFVYRFRADQAGTYWYHDHQQSAAEVRRGLFGSFVVLPRATPAPRSTDITEIAQTWDTDRGQVAALGSADTVTHRAIAPGTPVRLRLVNADAELFQTDPRKSFVLTGTPFRVAAIDGGELVAPAELRDTLLGVPRGGRFDITFTMPDAPVWLGDLDHPGVGTLYSPDGTGAVPAVPAGEPTFDPADYGRAPAMPFTSTSHFDRDFTLVIGDSFNFFDGGFTDLSTLNGKSFPHTPVLMVAEGDLVKTTLVNRSHETHPMHLHRHHMLVLTRGGEPVATPWWTDTLDVLPGEVYDVGFRADNPGMWMDHCHNLEHAAAGMTLHLAYAGVRSPFLVGRSTPNQPE